MNRFTRAFLRWVSRKEYTILRLLSEAHRLRGLELVELSGGVLKRGAVYVTLDRLEESGWVTRHERDYRSPHGFYQNTYAITRAGEVRLRFLESFLHR